MNKMEKYMILRKQFTPAILSWKIVQSEETGVPIPNPDLLLDELGLPELTFDAFSRVFGRGINEKE